MSVSGATKTVVRIPTTSKKLPSFSSLYDDSFRKMFSAIAAFAAFIVQL